VFIIIFRTQIYLPINIKLLGIEDEGDGPKRFALSSLLYLFESGMPVLCHVFSNPSIVTVELGANVTVVDVEHRLRAFGLFAGIHFITSLLLACTEFLFFY